MSEAARILRIIGKYAWAAADEIESAEPKSEKPEAVDLDAARKEAAERRRRLGGNA
jgi:hypothetical protein